MAVPLINRQKSELLLLAPSPSLQGGFKPGDSQVLCKHE